MPVCLEEQRAPAPAMPCSSRLQASRGRLRRCLMRQSSLQSLKSARQERKHNQRPSQHKHPIAVRYQRPFLYSFPAPLGASGLDDRQNSAPRLFPAVPARFKCRWTGLGADFRLRCAAEARERGTPLVTAIISLFSFRRLHQPLPVSNGVLVPLLNLLPVHFPFRTCEMFGTQFVYELERPTPGSHVLQVLYQIP